MDADHALDGRTLDDIVIDGMREADWPAVRAIYAAGIATGNATFETEPPEWPAWDAAHVRECRLVARRGSEVIAWAALSRVSSRQAYAGVAELSLYVAPGVQGRGVGGRLLHALLEASEEAGFWTLQSSTFPENAASLRLQIACGFREIGRRERIAQRDGRWRDTILLERRSQVVGA